MDAVLSHAPLALFTTLGLLGAGCFIALAIAFVKDEFSEKELKAVDALTLAPLAFLLAAFISAFFHLTNPANAVGVFSGIGNSPLSNEVAMGVILFIAAALYWVLAFTGNLRGSARKVFAAIVAVLALLFGFMCGLAYYVETIVSWAHAGTVLGTIGITLAGTLVGAYLLDCATKRELASSSLMKAVGFIGIALVIASAVYQIIVVNGFMSPMYDTHAMVIGALPYLVSGALLTIAAGCLLHVKKAQMPAVVLLILGVLLIRFAFYLLEVSISL